MVRPQCFWGRTKCSAQYVFESTDQIRTPNGENAMFSKSTSQTDRRKGEAVDPRD